MTEPIEPGELAVTVRTTYSFPRDDNDEVAAGSWFWVGKYIPAEKGPNGIAIYHGYNFMSYPFNEVWIPAEDVAPLSHEDWACLERQERKRSK